MKIGCVLMAAGFGRRFGGNKLQAEFDGGATLIQCALSAIPDDKLAQVVVVTQYPQVAELARKYGFTALPNPHPEVGQSESIRIGLQALQDCDAVLFQVADQPKLQKETVAELLILPPPTPTASWDWGTTAAVATPAFFRPDSIRSLWLSPATTVAAR